MKLALLFLALVGGLKAQTLSASPVNIANGAGGTCSSLAGDVTGSCAANTVIGVQTSGTLPATCAVGDVYSLTTGVQGFYTCGPTANNWTYTGPSLTPSDQIGNHLLSGCGVEYVSGLTFTVGACTYTINGVTYTSAITSITLTAASMTDPRIDVILVDSTGIATKITGTAATPPAEPSIDPSTQIGLIFVTVAANGTTPTGIVNTPLYLDNTEWTCASTANINCNSTSNPYQGTKDIEATAAVLGNNFTLVKPMAGTVDLSTQNALVFYIRSKAAWPSANGSGANGRRTLTLSWLNGSTAVGVGVVIADGAFGFNSSITASYQQISIPISLFGAGSNVVTTLKALVSGNGGTSSFGWYIDDVTLQSGTNAIVLPTTLMNFQGTWSATKAYNPNDVVVSSAGIGYVALVANTNVAVTTTTTWATLAPANTVTAAGTLTSNAVVIGGGTKAVSAISADTTTTHALFATATAPAFRALAGTDLPNPGASSLGGVESIDCSSSTAGVLQKISTSGVPSCVQSGILASLFVATDQTTTSTSAAGVDLATADTVTFTLLATTTVYIDYHANSYSSGTDTSYSLVYVDGVHVDDGNQAISVNANVIPGEAGAFWRAVSLGAGSHTVDIKHTTGSGTTVHWRDRSLMVSVTP